MSRNGLVCLVGALLVSLACGGVQTSGHATSCSGNGCTTSAANRGSSPASGFPRTVQICRVTPDREGILQLRSPVATSRTFYAEIFTGSHQVFEYKLALDADGLGDLSLSPLTSTADYQVVSMNFEIDAVYDKDIAPPSDRHVVGTLCRVEVTLNVRGGAQTTVPIVLQSGDKQAIFPWGIDTSQPPKS